MITLKSRSIKAGHAGYYLAVRAGFEPSFSDITAQI